MKQTFIQRIGRYLLTGLMVSAPAGITIILFVWAFLKLDSILGRFFQIWLGLSIPGVGFLALVLIVLFVGAATHSYVGRKLIDFTDALFTKLPVVKTIYLTAKQLQSLLEIRKKIGFHRAVLLEYPRRGLYVIGFLINEEQVVLLGRSFYAIFVPTTPNPTSGFLVFAHREQFEVLDIPIEDAIKLVITAGIIPPGTKTEPS